MKTYLFNLINKVKSTSEALDAKAVLCNKTWKVFNDLGEKEVYIFMEDGTLVISVNGVATIGSWKYIPANQSLIIVGGAQNFLVHPVICNNVLALVQDGTEQCAFLLDSTKEELEYIKSLQNIEGYIQKYINNSTDNNKILNTQQESNHTSLPESPTTSKSTSDYCFGENGELVGIYKQLYGDVRQMTRCGNRFTGTYYFKNTQPDFVRVKSSKSSPFTFQFENGKLTYIFYSINIESNWLVRRYTLSYYPELVQKKSFWGKREVYWEHYKYYEVAPGFKPKQMNVFIDKEEWFDICGNSFMRDLQEHRDVFIKLLGFDPIEEYYWEWGEDEYDY